MLVIGLPVKLNEDFPANIYVVNGLRSDYNRLLLYKFSIQ